MTPSSRRTFLKVGLLGSSGLLLAPPVLSLAAEAPSQGSIRSLPVGNAPLPVGLSHFPTRLHAFIWRNWFLVPLETMALTVDARPGDLKRIGLHMGLPTPPRVSKNQLRRSALTIIRRNWHLLPYDQLLALLGWTAEELAYALREDDFLYVKLGNHKPKCERISYRPSTEAERWRERQIAQTIRRFFPEGVGKMEEPLFGFVDELSKAPLGKVAVRPAVGEVFHPRYCYSYFALYGDPLLEPDCDPYPDGYLARLRQAGVDGVWMQAVLHKLSPFPWDPSRSARHEERIRNLQKFAARARKQGMGIYLYLNEPRSMPLSFYAQHPGLRGVTEGDFAAMCTSVPEVRSWIRQSVASICRAVPDLAGFFTISGSENLSNCWSHGAGAACPRCAKRGAAEVIAEFHRDLQQGIEEGGSTARLIAWDWGWQDSWVPGIIDRLPSKVSLMSVSEWSIPIVRGGVASAVGEYSISTIGPGPRATEHWRLAKKRGLQTFAKIQAGNTWELSAVPYIPALANVAQHGARLRDTQLDGIMLGWTLGGYPSPNLEIIQELGASKSLTPEEAMLRVAQRRFGRDLAPAAVKAWTTCSTAFSEFPFHPGLVYNAPMQYGPSNLLWEKPTGYRATMVGFPYDDLDGWRQVYPPDVFIGQFEKVANGFTDALALLRKEAKQPGIQLTQDQRRSLQGEMSVIEAAALHFQTTALQARFVEARRHLAESKDASRKETVNVELRRILEQESKTASRMHHLQCRDSRLGFEASNQYYYIPVDLAEKVLNCQDLLERWLPHAEIYRS